MHTETETETTTTTMTAVVMVVVATAALKIMAALMATVASKQCEFLNASFQRAVSSKLWSSSLSTALKQVSMPQPKFAT